MSVMGGLPPDPSKHRRFVPADQVPPPPPRPAPAQIMAITCPKCAATHRVPMGAGVLLCKADKPPWFGRYRGCGWFLALTPPHAGGDRGHADAVMDCARYFMADHGEFRFTRALQVKLYLAVWERWERRGMGKVIKLEDGNLAWQPRKGDEAAALATSQLPKQARQ